MATTAVMTATSRTYKARPGSRITDKQAQIYGECLEKIAEEKGVITPPDVVEEAKSETSPLHDYFEWDNEVAGEKYRLHQARNLINSIIVVVETPDETIEERAFFNVKIEKEAHEQAEETEIKQAYVPVSVVVREKPYRDQILEQALREINYWKRKYENLTELSVIFEAIETTTKKIGMMR
ncbi:hypothetical protein DRN72_04825 [Methanosarcinales archaeon]|nr:MAG: hypothetical protein DRN72_04825 [Methanosarcinales archaeon]